MSSKKLLSPSEHVAYYAARVKNNVTSLRFATTWTLGQRMRWLRDLNAAIKKYKQDIVDAISKDKARNPFYAVISEYKVILSLCDFYLRHGERFLGNENISTSRFSMLFGNKRSLLGQEPYGVFGIISASNYPFSLPLGAIVPALLAGNGVVWKPAPGTEKTAAIIYELLRDTLTPYCRLSNPFAIVDLTLPYGQALVACKDIDKIHFTGSVEAGKWIAQENAKVRPFTPPTLELGGSNPAIVLSDADIKMAAQVIVWARFAAMSCNNVKRVYAESSIFDDLLNALLDELRAAKTDEIEPLLTGEKERYKAFMDDYCAKYLPAYGNTGTMEPEILPIRDEDAKLLALTQETFVPLLPVVRVENTSRFAELANRSSFGMGASIFTRDKKKFRALARQLDCTTVLHNDAMTEFAMPQVPFGGRKNSGTGYTHGIAGLREFVQPKTVIEERWNAPKLQLFPWTPGKIKWLTRFIDKIK